MTTSKGRLLLHATCCLALFLGDARPSDASGTEPDLFLGPPRDAALEIVECRTEPRFFTDERATGTQAIFADLLAGWGGCSAVILRQQDGRWTMHDLLDRHRRPLSGQSWHFVGSSGELLWAVLDNNVESYGWELDILRSADHGRSWTRTRLRKVFYLAWFDSFRMAADGTGRLTIRLDDDYGTEFSPGLYHYRTTDFGVTWSEPEFEADAMVAAATGAVPGRGWHPSAPFQEAWQSFADSVPKRLPPASSGNIEDVTLKVPEDPSVTIVTVHTDFAVQPHWSRESLPQKEVIRLGGVHNWTDPRILLGDGWRLNAIRTGYHAEESGGQLHLVLDLARPSVRFYYVDFVQQTDLVIAIKDEAAETFLQPFQYSFHPTADFAPMPISFAAPLTREMLTGTELVVICDLWASSYSPADPIELLADGRVRNRRAALAGEWRIEDGRLWIGAHEFTYNAFQRSLFSPEREGSTVGWHIFLRPVS